MPANTDYDADAGEAGVNRAMPGTVIQAIRSGDRYAFEEFVRTNGRWVRGVVFGVLGNRDIGDDVCQQVWTAVWQRIGELRDTSSWKSWVYRLARNAAVDAGRELTRRKAAGLSPSLVAVRPDVVPPVDVEAERTEAHREVLDAIRRLPEIYREPFVLRHLNGWSYREIGELMDLPVDTVETRLVRARRFLREALGRRLEHNGRAS